jgi:sensor histidine kinase regulating citrate/malate metabolism
LFFSLSNAVEAVSKLDNINKQINLEIRNLEDNIVIKVSNPVAKKVLIDGNKVNTSKSDKKSHGFGLENIKKTVEKYNGSFELNCNENEFKIVLIVKNKA